ncbi:MAG TPA: hypothetical protein DEQ74_03315 [Wolbachia sp.]|nr:hypothetical protein [Wolbachia sp.]
MLTCSKIVFQYKNDSPCVLEMHIGKHGAEELKEKIEKNSPLVIETQQDDKRYKYVIEKSHSCEIEIFKGVLKITFDGKVYRDGDLVDTQLKCSSVEDDNDWIVIEEQLCSFSHQYVDCYYTFYQQQKTEQQPAAQGDKAGKRVQFADEVDINVFSTNTSSSLTSTNDSPGSNNKGKNPPHDPPANTGCSTSIWCPLGLFAAGCLAMAGGTVLSFADRPDIGGILMASAIVCLLIVGVAKLCEKVSEKKQKDPDISTSAAVKSVFSGIFCSEMSANTNNCKI